MSAGAITSSAGSPSSTSNSFGAMSSEQFIKVMIEELTNQDPLNPQDSNALLEQLSSLRNIESQIELQDKLEALVLQNEISAAGGLIGKTVQGLSTVNSQTTGIVKAVRIERDQTLLELDNTMTVPMDNVTKVLETQDAETQSAISGSTTVLADLNGDGRVNAADADVIRTFMGINDGSATTAMGDLNGDKKIDQEDMSLLAAQMTR